YFTIFCLMLSIFPWLKHRSFSHSIFATIIVYFLLKQIELITNINNLSFYGAIGYASHMFLGDLFTKQGIPIFYPLSEKKISLGFLTVGGPFSNFIEKSFIFVLIGLIIFSILKL
ncbi:metal-dependent hydrolase, partial [Clostridioides difficile]|nr:metal-dependent hydrolase [Clostridioides difficile]